MNYTNLPFKNKSELIGACIERRYQLQQYSDENKILKKCCPCCGYQTLNERNAYEICIICNWEDDGQDDVDVEQVLGGPNGDLSLTQARLAFEYNFQKLEEESGFRRFHDSKGILNAIEGQIKDLEALISKNYFEKKIENRIEEISNKHSAVYSGLSHPSNNK